MCVCVYVYVCESVCLYEKKRGRGSESESMILAAELLITSAKRQGEAHFFYRAL